MRCDVTKHGRFDYLRCCLPYGHPGNHNLVVLGVPEHVPHSRKDLPAMDNRTRLKRKAKT